jgi:putative flippase GtrA
LRFYADNDTDVLLVGVRMQDKSGKNITATDVLGIKSKTPKQIAKFLLASMLTGAIGLGSFWLLSHITVWDRYPFGKEIWLMTAEAVSVLFSCIFSFLVNKRFTFKQRGKKHGLLLYILYYVVSTPLGGLLIVALVKQGMLPVLAKIIKMCINVVLDFLYCKFVVFSTAQQENAKDKSDNLSKK